MWVHITFKDRSRIEEVIERFGFRHINEARLEFGGVLTADTSASIEDIRAHAAVNTAIIAKDRVTTKRGGARVRHRTRTKSV